MNVFIVNSISGNGKGQKIWPFLEERLKEMKQPYEVFMTQYPGHAREVAQAVSQRPEVRGVVAVGGDGTVHEVVGGLAGSSLPLGYIPAGSGNDFARAQGIPMSPLAALERIYSPKPATVDTAIINGSRMASTAGVGFDAMVAQAVNRSSLKKWLGKLAYVWHLIRLLFVFQPREVTVVVDGKTHNFQRVWLIAVTNIPFYGGGMKICPQACNRDGILDICVVKGISRWKLLFVFPKVFKGVHVHHSAVTMLKGARIEIRSDSPMVVHTDGEIIGESPVQIEVCPQSLNTL